MNFRPLFIFLLLYHLTINVKALSINIDPPSDQSSISKKILTQLENLDKLYPNSSNTFNNTLKKNDVFSFKTIHENFPVLNTDRDNRAQAQSTFKEIADENKWIDNFSNEDIQSLPVGLKKEVSNITYQVGFSKAYFNKDYTELTVFVRIVLPQTNENGEPIEIFFGANNVKLSHDGGLMGEANLVLLGDVFIPFNAGNWLFSLKGGFNMETGVTQNTTYATIDCNGVKEFSLLGEIQFSRSLILPIDADGNPAPEKRTYTRSNNEVTTIPNRVRGEFQMVASDWNDIVLDISLSPFALAKHPDKFLFEVNEATLDFSDLRTPDIPFPAVYQEQNLLQPSIESWRGVYVNSLSVALPKEFKTRTGISDGKRVTFSAHSMLIDDYGVSGFFEVENIFPLKEGRTSESNAWAYSLEKLGVDIQANTLVRAEFEGQVLLPLSNMGDVTTNDGSQVESLGLAYKGLITEEEYLIRVASTEALNFDIWQAKARIDQNSAIEMRVQDGNFLPKAILYGHIDIKAKDDAASSDSSSLVDFEGIRFQNLQIQTVSPILKVDYFGYQGKLELANFPVSISDIGLNANDYEASLDFNLHVSLMNQKDKGFAGSTKLSIIGKIESDQGRQHWKYKKLDLDKIELNANLGKVKLEGGLELMRDDPEYGNGFMAEIKGTFGKFGPITTKAIFGKKDFRYWYVDGSVQGLKIQAGIIQINGFAGGACYRMNRRPGVSVAEFSPSGLSYVPDDTYGLGVKAMIMGGIPDEEAISIAAGFEIAFNKSFGINRLGFFGEVQLMKSLEFPNPAENMQSQLQGIVQSESNNSEDDGTFFDKSQVNYPESASGSASIEGKIGINYDFVNDAFHADMQLYLNTPGGFLQGYGPGGLAGWGVIHIEGDEWYAYLGTPSKRCGIKLGVGPISLQTTGYFMTGTQLEDSPPPPQEVADIIGVDVDKLRYMRDENSLSSGGGFAFGADFRVDTGDLKFLMFYARFMAGAGFDIMLRDYGESSCVNTGRQIGIDGWYANGQCYVYLQGEMGIRVKLFFIKKKIPIIEAAAAMLIQGKGPNPIWMRGYLAGKYNLLGGLVKGGFRFKITLGKECIIQGASPIGGIKMIADVTPKDNSSDIDVFAAPQATFSMQVNVPIVVPEDSGDKTYKVILEKMEIKDDTGNIIEGELEWGQSNDRVTLFSKDILPPNSNLTVTCQLSFQEYVNGGFRVITENGQKALETEVRTFKTGTAPNHIPLHNIEYCYPVVNQKFMHPKEYPTGYIQLKRGQDYLFDDADWSSQGLIAKDEDEEVFPINYNLADNQITYNLPDLTNTADYLFKITSSPKSTASNTKTGDVKETIQELDKNNTFVVSQKEADDVTQDGNIDRLSYSFTTSNYNTFSRKVDAINITNNQTGILNSNSIFLISKIQEFEGFDVVELEGTAYTDNKSLIVREATLDDAYYLEDIKPIVYQQYPLYNHYYFYRDVDLLGVPPKKAIPIIGSYLEGIKYDTNHNFVSTTFPFRYNLPKYYEKDIYDIKVQINNRWVSGIINSNAEEINFIDSYYEFMRNGKYGISLKYILPGNKERITKRYNFKNPLTVR